MNEKKIIKDKSFTFALRIVKMYKFLVDKKEFTIHNSQFTTHNSPLNKILASIIITSKDRKYGKK
jgi:hypothetical protein